MWKIQTKPQQHALCHLKFQNKNIPFNKNSLLFSNCSYSKEPSQTDIKNIKSYKSLVFIPLLHLTVVTAFVVVMVSVLTSSAVDRGLEPRSGQTKTIKLVFVSSPLSTQH